jgi:5-methylcytosine-specific restriction endonuclease McrA
MFVDHTKKSDANNLKIKTLKFKRNGTKMKKKHISASLKTSVWIHYVGQKFNGYCCVEWCKTNLTPFTFEVGHNIPESKGGSTTIDNLRPICSQCNKSMGNKYTITEYSTKYKQKKKPNVFLNWLFCKHPNKLNVEPTI